MNRAGKSKQEACRRKTGAKNVGVCTFGQGVGKELLAVEARRQKEPRPILQAGVPAGCLTADLGR